MRTLVLSGICACMAMAVSASACAQDVAAEGPVAAAAVQDPTTFDPFAASETETSPAHTPSTPPQATEASVGAPEEDPFATAEIGPSPEKIPLRFTRSIDLLYQGSYLPDLISTGGGDHAEQDVFIDTALNWDVSDSATLGARVVANHEERKSGATSNHSNDVTALEYFYRQQFASGAQAFTIGRKLVGWSSGFQWRPADLIDNGFSTKSIDIQDPYRYRGVGQVRYELIQPGFDVVAIVSNDAKGFYGGKQFAAKISLKRAADVSLMYAVNGDYSRKYGVIVDTNLRWGTTLALEAVHVDIDADMIADASHFGRTLESLSGIHRYEDVYFSLTKFIDDQRRVSVEYFHNGRGLGDASGRSAPFASIAASAPRAIDPAIFSQQYLGRNYAYVAYTGYVDAWKLQFKPSVLTNLGDDSFIGSISIKRELGDSSELTLNINTFHGSNSSEFGSITNGVGVGMSYVFHFL